MNNQNIRLTSSEIGSLWGEYVNGTAAECVNKYMYSIIEDPAIKGVFEEAIQIFENQKRQIVNLLQSEGFLIPRGFSDEDINLNAARLFSDIFCLQYLHIMTIHGMHGHVTSLNVSVRKDIRQMFDAFDNDGKNIFHKTTDLLLEKGMFQRDPYVYPQENIEFVSTNEYKEGLFKTKRPLAATEIISISLNIKKNIMAKSLSIAFSQVIQSEETRKFLLSSQKTADGHIQDLTKIMQADNLPVPTSWETEILPSQQAPFSDKLIMYHMGFLFQVAQVYIGAGLATVMRTDLIATYEKIILKNLAVVKNWFDIMIENNWLEQPPLAPDRIEIAEDK
jgi:hypothetical protein